MTDISPDENETHGSAPASGNATVVIVGAGLSGLVAARELHRRGVDVLVLEAAQRVGGRALSETSALGSRLDLGGQWIGHDHDRVVDLAAELGLRRFPMHTALFPRVIDGDRRIPLVSPSVISAAVALAVLAVLVRFAAPDRSDGRTGASWLRRVPGRTARRLLEVGALISWTTDLDRLSVSAMAMLIRRQGGLRTMLSTNGGAQESLLVEGAGSLAERLAGELGSRVRTGQQVTAIDRDDAGVTVHTASSRLRADRVIVTAPPPVAARIRHDPPLPAERASLEATTYMGSVYKAVAVYAEPFWRKRGGELVSLGEVGCAVFDTTPPGGPGHLCVLVGGAEARALDDLGAAERQKAVLGPLAPHLGPSVVEPVSWHEKSWHLDEHVGGGYLALPEVGTTDGFWPFPAPPVGHVHWAGTETAQDHPGHLDGAIEAGRRSARDVIATLPAPATPTP